MGSTTVMSFHPIRGLVLGLFFFAASINCNNSGRCGSLITYNQFSSILSDAPTCFKDGCGSDTLASMSTACSVAAPCHPLWKILNQEYQQDWCQICSEEDMACRISGWPIMNATTACDISPNAWLFENGGCCSNPNEISSLAEWIQTVCNDTWRSKFEFYNGMAKQDWAQYELPVNWTVQPDNTTQPKCAPKSNYLGIFVAENLVFLIFAPLYLRTQLWLIKEKGRQPDRRNIVAKFLLNILKPFGFLKKNGKYLFRLLCGRPLDKPSSGAITVIGAILFAIFMSGVQVGSNFINAWLIQATPGYHHVPLSLLALLFCCRPRLGWFACYLSLIDEDTLINHFHLIRRTPENKGTLINGKAVVAKVAIGSAMSEIVMQLLGSYFLGKTAHVGAMRNFYVAHHLSPFWNGKPARIMYVGALFWLIAGLFVVISWVVVLIWGVRIFHFLTASKNRLKDFYARRAPKALQSKKMQQEYSARKNLGPPVVLAGTEDGMHHAEGHNYPAGAGQGGDSNNIEGHNHPAGAGQGGESNNPEAHNHPGRAYSGTQGSGSESIPAGFQNMRGGAGSNTQSQFDDQSSTGYESLPMRPQDFPTAASTSDISSTSRWRLLEQSSYSVPSIPEMTQIRNDDPASESLLGPLENQPGGRAADSSMVVEGMNHPATSRRLDHNSNRFVDTAYHGAQNEDIDRADKGAEQSPYHHGQPERSKLEELLPYIIHGGVAFGFISYIAQWFFWAGFVYALGDKFCPPNLVSIAIVWAVASVLSIGAAFGPP